MMGFGGIGMILMLLFWGGLIFGGVWLVSMLFNNSQNRPATPRQSTAREILDQRYANGEINREEYEMMKNDVTV